jgi:hypothetical protein
MSRIIIVEKISGIHVGRGKFYANIKDQYCPWNNNTFLFESVDGILKVVKENSNEAFDLTIEGLTWLVYNGGDPGYCL